MSLLEYTHENGVATITFNNPPQNRLANELTEKFTEAIIDLSQRKDTRVIYLKANGTDFSFGADVGPWLGISSQEVHGLIENGVKLSNLFEDLPVPIVAAVQGHCMGGGFEFALRADVIVAADNAKFGHPEATIGVFTLLGGVQRVAERIGRTRAMQMALTAELLPADKAFDYGLINEVVPLDQLENAAQAWVQKLSKTATLAHADHKKLLRAWSDGGVHAADALMAEMAAKTVISEDVQGSLKGAIEAIKAGKPRPQYDFKGK